MTRTSRLPLTSLFALTLTLGLVACGGDDDCEEDEKVLGVCPDAVDGGDDGGDAGGGDDGGGDGGGGDAGGGDGGGTTFSSLYSDKLNECGVCHTPNAAGRTSLTETNLDFTSRDTAYSTITGKSAAGMSGNQEDCNGVPFVGANSSSSLIVAVLDGDVRAAFDSPAHPNCDGNGAISDMNIRSPTSASIVAGLKSWIDAGAPND